MDNQKLSIKDKGPRNSVINLNQQDDETLDLEYENEGGEPGKLEIDMNSLINASSLNNSMT